MSRLQLALNVADLDASIDFYRHVFGVEPHKLRPGYANFQINEPPLKLVLLETSSDKRGTGVQGALNHLGIEVKSSSDVTNALIRLQNAGLAAVEELDTTCCYAKQDKVWVHDPAGTPWEIYAITDDDPVTAESMELVGKMNDGACCTPGSVTHADPAPADQTTPADETTSQSAGCC